MLGCMPRNPVIPSHRVYAPDGATVAVEGTVSIGIVGATRELANEWSSDPLIADLKAHKPDFLVLTGDYVARSTFDEWEALHRRWDRVLEGVVALPGYGERRRDRRLEGHGAAFAGQGVPELRGVPFWHFDIESEGSRWRFVMIDAEAHPLGTKWRDQLFWLPKVVTGDSYDHLVVAINRPLDELAGSVRPEIAGNVSTLLRLINDHADPTRLVAVLSGGGASNNIVLPAGDYGEVHVLAGNAGIAAADLKREGRRVDRRGKAKIEPGFEAALDAELNRWVGAGVVSDAGYSPDWESGPWKASVMPIVGWWRVELEGSDIAFTFRIRCHDASHHDLYRIRHTRAHGWKGEPLAPSAIR